MAHKKEHLAALLQLPPDERLAAANALFDSVDADSEDPNWEAAWATELRRRLDGLLDGSREGIAAGTVYDEARKRLSSHDS